MSAILCVLASLALQDDGLRPAPLRGRVTRVQPMTGIVLWSDSEHVRTDAIQLEFAYMKYGDIVARAGEYDWAAVERVLGAAAGRGHQAILRFYDTYVGKKTTVPAYIKALPDYRETSAPSEKKPTGFPDWSHPELKRFILEFYGRFAEKYDADPRLCFVETGFGLWSEYHIYDGPLELGKTFPDKDFQEKFLKHLGAAFRRTPWMISIDAAAEWAPLAARRDLLELGFGTFDDSFLCRQHAKENAPNWAFFGPDRHLRAPAGGEFSYYNARDQKDALAAGGPHGVAFEAAAREFHITFMIGNDQPLHRSLERIREAGLACGYRFRIQDYRTGAGRSSLIVLNAGVAPLYHDAFVAVNGTRAAASLKGLRPGERRTFDVPAAGGAVTIESDRLVPGQRIEFDADLDPR
jgi:hypothetical protein